MFNMENNKNMKILSIINAIIAWILMVFLIFALGNTTGDLLKTSTYVLAVGNLMLASHVCKNAWKK